MVELKFSRNFRGGYWEKYWIKELTIKEVMGSHLTMAQTKPPVETLFTNRKGNKKPKKKIEEGKRDSAGTLGREGWTQFGN